MNFKELEEKLNINHAPTFNNKVEEIDYYVKQFMLTIPFENIDVQNGVPISLEIEDLYDKIVHRHRGGYCYELNVFFKAFIEHHGFNSVMAAATIHTPSGGRSLNGSHMALITTIDDDKYVTDVGFGDLPTKAMPITESGDATVTDVNGTYRAVLEDEYVFVQKYEPEQEEWDTKYHLEYKARTLDDFSYNIYYNQHDPNSTFVKRLLVTMPTEDGRITMSQDHFTKQTKGNKEKIDVTADNYRDILREHFGIDERIDRIEK
ncbi:arylamine N-acetyltransferase [Staphylococcus sp. 11261D007BR]